MDMLCFCFFSFINDITSWYFHSTPAQTDWLASTHLIGRALGGIAMCLFSERTGLRNVAVTCSAMNAVASLMIGAGVFLNIFPIAIAGAFVNGVSSLTLLTIMQHITVIWFPPTERGIATSAPWAARRLSLVVSIIISTRTVGSSISENHADMYLHNNETAELRTKFKVTYSIVFGTFAFLSLLCCVFSRFYVTDTAPVFVGDEHSEENSDEIIPILRHKKFFDLRREIRELIHVVKNPALALLYIMLASISTEVTLGFILISSIVVKEFPEADDQTVGMVSCIGIIIGAIGSVIAGAVIDRFRKPRLTYISLAAISAVALSAFSLCLHIRNLPGVYAAYLLMSVPREGLLVCIVHHIAATVPDQRHSVRIKVFTIVVMSAALSIVASTTVIRVLVDNVNSTLAVLFPLPFLLWTVVLYILLWSRLQQYSSVTSKW